MPGTRRDFLKNGAALAAATVVLRNRSFAQNAAGPTRLSQFEYGDVQLLDGPMLEQFHQNVSLFMSIPDDDLLKPFRQLTGLPAPGNDMGGWYSPSKDFDPPKNMTGYVPGHTFGQYMSGLARSYAATGDKATQAKVHSLVEGFAPTAQTKFYEGYCLPCYTFDKTNCGLIDAHQFAGCPDALKVLDKATDAVMPWLPPKALNRDEMAARPHPNIAYTWDESYTLPENFYLAYQRGAGDRYRQLARRFLEDDTYFGPLSKGENVLPGQHAYSHVNALSSAMQAYMIDGSEMHLRAAKNGFQYVLEQSYATGGWGPNESFRKPESNDLADSLHSTHASFETPCGAYGVFKIVRYLMRAIGESTYGDAMEAVLYNTILGARPIRRDGISFYYSDYNNDAHKADYEQAWPCCSGTFPQITADYGISSYFHSPQGVYVNLFVPSKVTWKQAGARVAMTQETSYPNTNETTLLLKMDRPAKFAVALRVPAWAGADTKIRVNGKPSGITARAGSWALVERGWKDGDRIEYSIDMPLRLIPIDARHPNIVALVHGPVALFAIDPGTSSPTRTQLMAAQRTGEEWEVSSGAGKLRLKSFPAITNEKYRLYHEV